MQNSRSQRYFWMTVGWGFISRPNEADDVWKPSPSLYSVGSPCAGKTLLAGCCFVFRCQKSFPAALLLCRMLSIFCAFDPSFLSLTLCNCLYYLSSYWFHGTSTIIKSVLNSDPVLQSACNPSQLAVIHKLYWYLLYSSIWACSGASTSSVLSASQGTLITTLWLVIFNIFVATLC